MVPEEAGSGPKLHPPSGHQQLSMGPVGHKQLWVCGDPRLCPIS